MYDHIVIPVEIAEAETYQHAAKIAAALSNEAAKITLLHVVEPIPTYVTTYIPPEIQTESRDAAKQGLSDMAKTLGIENTALVLGSAGRSIVDWAEENDADCIVIKSHKPEFSDYFLGSTAAWVVRHAKTNVHVLR